MEKKPTKELFLIEALRLFAERGYDAVSVAQIASAVGCSAPALYKHFSNKQALFDAIIEKSNQAFALRMGEFGVSFRNKPEEKSQFLRFSEEEQVKMMQQFFLHTLDDEFPTLFRKMMTVEQFKREDLAMVYNRRYVDQQFDAFEALMQEAIDKGIYPPGNARAMAIQYISPVIVYIGVCDRDPDKKKEALQAIDEHIRQFNNIYRQSNP